MSKGKIIVIEGTDCSGKGTQTKMLVDKLRSNNIEVEEFDFPNYDSPTGKIIGGPYLGKKHICDGWFPEGAANVNPLVASLYFAADRFYNLPVIEEMLDQGRIVILNRYTYSNMGHQGGKLKTPQERDELYNKLYHLEFEFLGLPLPDLTIFLHMPYDASEGMRNNRTEKLDQHECSKEHLLNAEQAYVELAKKYHWHTIECAKDNEPRAIDDIAKEVYENVSSEIN